MTTIYQIIRNVPGDEPWHMSLRCPTLEIAQRIVRMWRNNDDAKSVRYDIVKMDRDADGLPWRVTNYWLGVIPDEA